MRIWFYEFTRVVLNILFFFFPVRVKGKENLPEEGGTILCSNHISALDPLIVAVMNKRRLHYMAKKELFERQPVKWIVESLGAFPVDRGKADLKAVRTGINYLKNGEIVGIFPQGTRDETWTTDMQTGVALLALRSGALLVPLCFMNRVGLFRPTHVIVGKPVDLTEFGTKTDSVTLKAATDKIARAITDLHTGTTD